MSRAVGGDCVDIVLVGGRRIVMLVGDVSGKGIAAAMVMSSVQATFRTLVTLGHSLEQLAVALDQHLLAQRTGRYVTAALMQVDTVDGSIEYINAGHVPIHVIHDGTVLALTSNGPPLGLLPEATWQAVCLPAVMPPATLIVVTDGITERCTADNEDDEYGVERLGRVLRGSDISSSQEIVDRVLTDNDAFAQGSPAHDDLTVVALRIRAA
jgi:sigma-B regulation protein RsbU (phosphoserine phosphatase)